MPVAPQSPVAERSRSRGPAGARRPRRLRGPRTWGRPGAFTARSETVTTEGEAR
ncbi:hypothetical protein N177_2616 [Lutibaculum baratangense AMV1]|uniref:Uncharacterized protein n=1 Tax=Lutibaculum baratangense AMV1 TaxID=631454 RepID=V4QWN3_9HYPH|nr:hypothetical protein N177_2616 [Lutibaculum baratangense AMV1]